MTDSPIAYVWSSASAHCGHRTDVLLTHHTAYAALGATSEARGEAYLSLLRQTLSDDDLAAIRTYLQQQRALGRDDFRIMVEAKTRRFASVRPAHRPPRPAGSTPLARQVYGGSGGKAPTAAAMIEKALPGSSTA